METDKYNFVRYSQQLLHGSIVAMKPQTFTVVGFNRMVNLLSFGIFFIGLFRIRISKYYVFR